MGGKQLETPKAYLYLNLVLRLSHLKVVIIIFPINIPLFFGIFLYLPFPIKTGMKCEDRHPTCPEFAKQGQCSANPGWMEENCKKSCGSKRCDKEPVRPLGEFLYVYLVYKIRGMSSVKIEFAGTRFLRGEKMRLTKQLNYIPGVQS